MKKSTTLKRIGICSAILLSSLLGSCISMYTGRATLIDTGGAIANIGQQRPRLRPELPPKAKDKDDYQLHYRTWKKGDRYLVELPVCYAPANYSVINHFAGHDTWRKKTLKGEYPHHFSEAELAQFPVEYYYAELTEEQYKELWPMRKIVKRTSYSPFRHVPIFAACDMNWEGAIPHKDIYDHPSCLHKIWLNSEEIPTPRRTWYNQCLRPISWVAEGADIPLSLIATPIGWVVDAIYEPLAN